jgi:hypothetical protein
MPMSKLLVLRVFTLIKEACVYLIGMLQNILDTP